MTKERLLYHNRIAKLLEYCNVIDEINERLSKYYDCLFIDEVQDFAGHDFNLLKNICKSKIEILLVGDFYQHTFDTSRDGNTNAKIHSDFNKYQELFKKIKIIPDSESLNKSYRCTKSVCDFISNKIGIKIQSHKETHGTVLFLESDNM
jgi:DNA helicase-2/ATP-dependent DNA helicase PcrA